MRSLSDVRTPTLTRHRLSRRTQQRGVVPRVCAGLLAIYPKDVPRKRGRHTQRTKGRRVGEAQGHRLRIIPRKCRLYLLRDIYHTDRASLGIQIALGRRIPGPHHSPRTARAPEPPHGPVHDATFATSRCVSCHTRPSPFPRLRLRPPHPKRTGDLLRALRGRIRQSR